MRKYALVACVAACGCAPPNRPVVVAAEACRGGPAALWLDFEGAGVVHANGDDAAAMPVTSVLAATSAVIPPFDSTVSAPAVTRSQAIDAVVDRVRTLFLPFDVRVSTTRPVAAPYTRILVGGMASALGVTATEAGLARLDCGNATDGDVAYVFAGELTPDYGGVVGVANVAAHEAGHAFGLEHVTAATDVMYAVASPSLTLPELFGLSFGSGSYSSYGAGTRLCSGGDPIDEAAALACNVGLRAGGGDVTSPSLTWNPPASDVATRFRVAFDASDDVGVVRVEVYKNLELIASLDAPPYEADISATPSEHFYVTVEAIDAAANRAVETRIFTAASAPTGGSDGGVAPAGDLAVSDPVPSGRSGGCSIAPPGNAVAHPGETSWPGVMLALACAVAAVRARRRSSGSG
ncbi:MAG: hypothetical protein JWN44_4495 [Myxococcales bacterium]|nr:hypothetical protein [Myxococcales bacterium]